MSTYQIGDLVFYIGSPILEPPIWHLIVKNTNGIINLNEMAIIMSANVDLRFSTLFFLDNQLEIPRISWKYLKHAE